MPTTSNFGWTTPADTDLVKDGAAAIRTLGNGIDTSFLDLKGGTTGQVLSKASNTDLDFTWSAADPLSILDAKGDLISATAADTPARLAVGSNGQVLTADSTTSTGLKWAALPASGKVLQIVQDVSTTQESTTSATYVDTLLSIAITPSSASSKVLCILAAPVRSANTTSTTSVLSYYNIVRTSTEIAATNISYEGPTGNLALHGTASIVYLDSPSTTSATTYKVQMRRAVTNNTTFMAVESQTATLTLIEIGA